jgi:hypothetical protein
MCKRIQPPKVLKVVYGERMELGLSNQGEGHRLANIEGEPRRIESYSPLPPGSLSMTFTAPSRIVCLRGGAMGEGPEGVGGCVAAWTVESDESAFSPLDPQANEPATTRAIRTPTSTVLVIFSRFFILV